MTYYYAPVTRHPCPPRLCPLQDLGPSQGRVQGRRADGDRRRQQPGRNQEMTQYRKRRTAAERERGIFVPKKVYRRSGAAPVRSRRTKQPGSN
jgi:hypothetical protein